MAKIELPAAPPEVPIHADEFAGQGGHYMLDPRTGKRRLVARTDAPKQPEPVQPAETEE